MSTDAGIAADSVSWLLFAGLAAFWYWSLRLVPNHGASGWHSIPMSFLGLFLVGFAVDFLLRFPVLCWDSYVFGNLTSRIQVVTRDEINESLIVVGLYLACVVAAHQLGSRLFCKLVLFDVHIPTEQSRKAQLLLVLLSTIGIVLSTGHIPVPNALVTPLGILGSFWVVPAALVWCDEFRAGNRVSWILRWGLLLPGLLKALLSPYRENLLMPVVVVVIAALYAGRRFKLVRVAAAMVVLFLISTVIISVLRDMFWSDFTFEGALRDQQSSYTLEKTYNAVWVQALRRFHGLDSVLLTVRYVPDAIPYSERNVVADAIVRGFVPRAIYAEKEGSDRGVKFGQEIWGADNPGGTTGGNIAPSMPGDLYEVNGYTMVVIGAIFWGLLLGVIEGLKDRTSFAAAAALTALFSLHVLASVERDFAHVVSTTIQYLLVMAILAAVLGRRSRRPRGEELTRRPA